MNIPKIIIITLIIILITWGLKTIDNIKRDCKNNLRERVILQKDTLIITGYSLIWRNYTLSNGAEIDFALIDSLKVVK
jgi:hypothetical protein